MLRAKSVSKKFGSLEALKPLSVDFLPGEVHAVIGENGAGKSTLMNILGGFLSPSSGSVWLDDKDLPKGDPQRCRSLGIEMIHQHFKLVPAFTIEENLRLSQLGIGEQSINEIKAKAGQFGWGIPWISRVQDVSVGTQQRVEILKSVATNPSVVIFDEPTAVLAKDEVAELIQFLRQLAQQGKTVILIAHKIEEVLAASDRITVLRRGEHIGTMPRSEVQASQLIDMMVGGAVDALSANTFAVDPNGKFFEASDLWVRDDRGQNAVQGLNLRVQKGEIVGIGGVDGNGQVELAEALAGVREWQKGMLNFEGQILNFDKTFVGYVPQDRQVDGLAVNLNIVENMAVSALLNGEAFSRSAQTSRAAKLVEQYSIKAKSTNDLAKQLSGGNQQKVILARVLDQNPQILVVVNPTRGLDVKAAGFVHQKLLEAAEGGAYVVVITTDRDELFEVSNKQWFLSRGKLFVDEKEALAS
jgi:ABC-type uncharacterized transport system ATPase subunit